MSWFLDATIGGYVNAQMVYLLRDEDYFDVEEDRQGRVSSNILTFASLTGMAWTFFAGPIYDLYNRRKPLIITALVASSFVALLPLTAPKVVILCLVRGVIMMGQTQLVSSPLIGDYIKKESHGMASMIQSLGTLFGEAF